MHTAESAILAVARYGRCMPSTRDVEQKRAVANSSSVCWEGGRTSLRCAFCRIASSPPPGTAVHHVTYYSTRSQYQYRRSRRGRVGPYATSVLEIS
eukprot:622180-Rhodomonas_salina.1